MRQTFARVKECSTSFTLSYEFRMDSNLSDSSWMKSATVTAFRSHFSIEAILISVICVREGGEGGKN